MRDLDIDLQKKFRRQFIGQTAKILVEKAGAKPSGRAERYFITQIKNPAGKLKKNDLVEVKLIKNNDDSMTGEI